MISDAFAKYAYDDFRLSQPHIPDKGLWLTSDGNYWIFCPGLTAETKAINGEMLTKWFRDNRPIGCRINLTSELPQNSQLLPERTQKELVFQSGSPRTLKNLYYDLHLELGTSFPYFKLKEFAGKVLLITEKELALGQKIALETAKANLGFFFVLEHTVDPQVILGQSKMVMDRDGLQLISSKTLSKSNVSQRLKTLYEEDEDVWLSHRVNLLTTANLQNDFLHKNWKNCDYKCLVQSSSFPPDNIKTYLSLYDTVIYEMPLIGNLEEFLNHSGLSKEELLLLFEMGRIRIILPQSVDRYKLSLLEDFIEINPEYLLFPRRLTCQNIIHLRNQIPFLLPTFGIKERKALLAALFKISRNTKDQNLANYFYLIASEYGRIWSQIEYRLSREGPMSSASLGLGFIAGGLGKMMTGKDVTLEFATTAPAVEWSFALKSDLIPIQVDGFSNEAHSRILLSLYDGMPRYIPNLKDRTQIVVKELLAVGRHVPIIDFANEINGGDLARFRKLVFDLVRSGSNEDDIKSAVERLNHEVRLYEKSEGALNKIDLFGLAISLTSSALKAPPGMGWLFDQITPYIESHAVLGAILDTLRGIKTLDPPYRPFIARLKNKLRKHIE